MKIILIAFGLASAAVGAVFVVVALWLFGTGQIRSIFSPDLWLWIGLHTLFAFVSLMFFRAIAQASGSIKQEEVE